MKKMKKRYAVLCHRADCGDETVFQLENEHGADWWFSKAEALKAMRADYHRTCEEYNAEDPSRWEVASGEIRLDVPALNAETGKEDLIRFHWKVMEID